jgi:hypothetical protein
MAYQLTSGGFRLRLGKVEDQPWGVEIVHLASQCPIASTANPVRFYLYREEPITSHSSPYKTLTQMEDGLLAEAELSVDGTLFKVTDQYQVDGIAGAFRLSRQVVVSSTAQVDGGFLSAFELDLADKYRDYLWFIPGVMYNDNSHVTSESVGYKREENALDGPWRGTSVISNLIREDRLPLPLAMAYHISKDYSIALIHLDVRGNTVSHDDELPTLVDDRLQFGTLGERHCDGDVSLCYWYPGTEGDISYPPMWAMPIGNKQSDSPVNPFQGRTADARRKKWSYRFHPIQDGFVHEYELQLLSLSGMSYLESLRRVWRTTLKHYDPQVHPVDLDRVYLTGIQLLSEMVEKPASGVHGDKERFSPVGIPTWIDCYTGKPGRLQHSYAMGFVGRNIEAGYLLLKEGRKTNNPTYIAQGEAIIDFWVQHSGKGLSHTELDVPEDRWVDAGTGPNGENVVFLRQESEGHHACLLAWEFENLAGVQRPAWYQWVKSYGDWLLQNQNEDGSFYRLYTISGEPALKATADCAHVIEFLLDMARLTGQSNYRDAAIRTGTYLVKNFHEKGYFIGGTLDNPNCCDKEACIIALEAYLALYENTEDQIWLEAARIAGTLAETWIYMWEVPMQVDGVERFYPASCTTVGLQLITCGFSAVDVYLSRHSYAFRRLAQLTGDRHYDLVAKILHHNTKHVIQLDDAPGKEKYYGYKLPGMQIEHWGMGLGRGYGLNSGWLPWVNTNPIMDIYRWSRD